MIEVRPGSVEYDLMNEYIYCKYVARENLRSAINGIESDRVNVLWLQQAVKTAEIIMEITDGEGVTVMF